MDDTSSINHHCLLNALHVYAPYFLSQPLDLHLCQPLAPVSDIRLQDYAQRTLLRTACAAQLVRAVCAVRHAASDYRHWSGFPDERRITEYARFAFPGADARLVQQMITDGRRILWLEQTCCNKYIGYLISVDWVKFQRMSNTQLFSIARTFLATPLAKGLLTQCASDWPSIIYSQYSGKWRRQRSHMEADQGGYQSKF